MQQVYPDVGLAFWMTQMLAQDVHYHLFTNDATIDRTINFPGLTEAAWAGYAVVTVIPASWAFNTVAHFGFAIAAPISFDNTSGAPVTPYGYYVTDSTDTQLLAAGKFDGFPITIPDGDSYVLIPSMGDVSRATVSP